MLLFGIKLTFVSKELPRSLESVTLIHIFNLDTVSTHMFTYVV
jgi:hypothetical protein